MRTMPTDYASVAAVDSSVLVPVEESPEPAEPCAGPGPKPERGLTPFGAVKPFGGVPNVPSSAPVVPSLVAG